jgi:pimeloyl-ACP methyl ester carboxylesterase
LASSPTDTIQRFAAKDGTMLAWCEIGAGRPVVLIHGLFSNAVTNWSRYGHAERIAAAGFRVIMPDLRGHGVSDAPHDPAHYPPDILADDGLAFLAHLGLTDFDLGGYSLGGRTVVRMLVKGAKPRRAIVAGMGLDGILHPVGRAGFFRNVLADPDGHPRGTPGYMAAAFLKTTGADTQALLPLVDSFVATSPDELRIISIPTLVCCGTEDQDNGSAQDLAVALADAQYVGIPGTHMSAVTRPELGTAIVDFLR